MSRKFPCLAFQYGVGKLHGLCPVVAPQRCNRAGRTALRYNVAGAAFAAATLSGHTEFELNFIERHSGTRMTRDIPIRNPTANTNDHGFESAVGWLLLKSEL